MSSRTYIVDTGYLLALYGVASTAQDTEAVRARFDAAVHARCARLVPLPVVFEFARRVSQECYGDRCAKIARDVHKQIADAQNGSALYVLAPLPDQAQLVALLDSFATRHAKDGLSLTDAAVLDLAAAVKRHYGNDRRVHIWTWERALRRFDAEDDPYPA